MAIRVIREYRTVFYEVILTLAEMIPYNKIAEANAATYYRIQNLRLSRYDVLKSIIKQMRADA